MTEKIRCDNCHARVEHFYDYCPNCKKRLTGTFVSDLYDNQWRDEPMFYECAMCGMEIVSFETVRGHKYCHSCAAIERNG